MLSRTCLRSVIVIARTSPARAYTSSTREGSVAASKEFGKKEKAHEDQYIKQAERKKLEKIRAEMEKKKAELEELQKQHDDMSSS